MYSAALTERQRMLYDRLVQEMQTRYEAYVAAKRAHDVFLETLAAGTDWPDGTNIFIKQGELVGERTSPPPAPKSLQSSLRESTP